MNKKIIGFVAVIILIVAGIVAFKKVEEGKQYDAEKNTSIQWKEYNGFESQGFTFQYPSDWFIKEEHQGGGADASYLAEVALSPLPIEPSFNINPQTPQDILVVRTGNGMHLRCEDYAEMKDAYPYVYCIYLDGSRVEGPENMGHMIFTTSTDQKILEMITPIIASFKKLP